MKNNRRAFAQDTANLPRLDYFQTGESARIIPTTTGGPVWLEATESFYRLHQNKTEEEPRYLRLASET